MISTLTVRGVADLLTTCVNMFQFVAVFVYPNGVGRCRCVRSLPAPKNGSLIGQPTPVCAGLNTTKWCSSMPLFMFAVVVVPSKTRFGTMSVMRQFVHGAGTDSGMLWISPLAGTENGP